MTQATTTAASWSRPRGSVPALACVLLLAPPLAARVEAQPGFAVYERRAPNGLPVYTVTPGDGEARRVFVFEGRPGVRSGLDPSAGPRAPGFAPLPASRPHQAPWAPGSAQVRRGGDGPVALAALASRRHGVDAALVLAVMEVESDFDAQALSPAGAIGLMQLMPQTARRYGADPWNVAANVDAGVRYLRDLLHLFGGDLRLVLAAYNAGEGRVIQAGYRVPRIAETLNYVPKVLDRHRSWSRHLAAIDLSSPASGAMAFGLEMLP